uniref:Uncharacterized protein n=1 Tax=uncultured Thiotrichaceae bacterium TaxID=298394 RepID=A0A6S6UIW2_9GAMM|nr:MAG: Unknown protein [uncultured Thiotrichaceae bacterium]
MKKLLLTTAVLILLLMAAWLGASWFVGLQTEKQVRQYLDSTGAQHVLVDYQRSLFSAQLTTRLDVSQTPLGQWVDSLPLVHKVMHGPLLLAIKPKVGLSQWQSSLDRSELDEHVNQLVDAAFSLKAPFQINIEVGFDQVANYQLNVSPLQMESYENDLNFSLGDLNLSGRLSLDAQQAESLAGFEMISRQLTVGNEGMAISLPALVFSKSGVAAIDKIEIEAAGISVSFPNDPALIRFNLAGQTIIENKGDDLQGGMNLTLNQFSGMNYPLNEIDFKLDFSGIYQPALPEVNRLQNRMQDIKAQLNWGEEELELPEARRQQEQLGFELRDVANQLLAVVSKQVLKVDKTLLDYDLKLDTAEGVISNNAALIYAGRDKPVVLDDLVDHGFQGLIRLVRGNITLDVAQAALPAEFDGLLSYPLEQKGLVKSGDDYSMDLRLLKSDMELNGRVIGYDELWDKFLPPSVMTNDTHQVPADVWVLIENQGLSVNLIEQLELRDDISAETMGMLRQLQETSQVLGE